MARVNIINLKSPDRLQYLRNILTRAVNYLRLPGDVNIVVLEPEICAKLNQEFRGQSYSPDVLSFAYCEKEVFGEVVINRAYIFGKNRSKGLSFNEKNFLRLSIHGLVHLAGYDHEVAGCDAKLFFKVERAVLRYLFKSNNKSC